MPGALEALYTYRCNCKRQRLSIPYADRERNPEERVLEVTCCRAHPPSLPPTQPPAAGWRSHTPPDQAGQHILFYHGANTSTGFFSSHSEGGLRVCDFHKISLVKGKDKTKREFGGQGANGPAPCISIITFPLGW